MNIDYLSVGLRIKHYRMQKGLSQDYLAEITDTSRPFIAKLEKGDRGLSLESLVSISEALDVTPNDILVESISDADRNPAIQSLLIDCTPSESAFLMKCFSAIKNILTDYTIK